MIVKGIDESAYGEVLSGRSLTIVEFYADYCPYCKSLIEKLEKIS